MWLFSQMMWGFEMSGLWLHTWRKIDPFLDLQSPGGLRHLPKFQLTQMLSLNRKAGTPSL